MNAGAARGPSSEITYDYAHALLPETGISPADLTAIAPALETARAETLADLDLWARGDSSVIPPEKLPLDAGFHELPDRLLADWRQHGDHSEVGQIQHAARRLASEVDRVVVLGIGGSYMGARALMEACAHPYHNELPRAARGGHPRIYFEGNNVDNDALAGLLDLLRTAQDSSDPAKAWGLIVISKSGGTLETAVATRLLVEELEQACGDPQLLARRVLPVTGASGKLYQLSQALGCHPVFNIPEGVGGRFSILSAVGLLPAAIMGLDIVALLEGAAAMNARFRSEPVAKNIVLNFVGVCHQMEALRGATIRLLSTWGKRLEAVGLWYDQLLAESLGKAEQGATPLTVVNTRDLHSRGQQHQEGKRDKLITNVFVASPERPALSIPRSSRDQDGLNRLAGRTVPDILAAAIGGTNEAYLEDRRPTTDLRLPWLDEFVLGQLFQMLMLATVVEGRLMRINPYGQPGVEAYKKHMNARLG